MKIEKLDHVNIQTNSLETMVSWYETFLGLRNGPRPDFAFPGAWLYADDFALVHLVSRSDAALMGSEQSLKLEHFAFSGSGREAFENKLSENDIPFSAKNLEEVGLVQYHLRDPDGNHIHVDFPLDAKSQ